MPTQSQRSLRRNVATLQDIMNSRNCENERNFASSREALNHEDAHERSKVPLADLSLMKYLQSLKNYSKSTVRHNSATKHGGNHRTYHVEIFHQARAQPAQAWESTSKCKINSQILHTKRARELERGPTCDRNKESTSQTRAQQRERFRDFSALLCYNAPISLQYFACKLCLILMPPINAISYIAHVYTTQWWYAAKSM